VVKVGHVVKPYYVYNSATLRSVSACNMTDITGVREAMEYKVINPPRPPIALRPREVLATTAGRPPQN
jgi:hypothetical protein